MITARTRNILKKVCAGSLFGLMIMASGSFVHEAVAAVDEDKYVALTTIPGFTVGCKPAPNGSTAGCVNTNPLEKIKNLYGVSIGIAAVLAVIMIIWAGVEYATAEAITGKSDAKEKWHGAFAGLALLLCSYLLLRTINIDLVNINLSLGTPVGGDGVDSGTLSGLLKQSETWASNATAQARIAQQNLATETSRLNQLTGEADQLRAEAAELEGSMIPEDVERLDKIMKDLPQLTADIEAQTKVVSDYQATLSLNTMNAVSANGSRDIARMVEGNKEDPREAIRLATNAKSATEESLIRQIEALPPGPAKNKATATLQAFNVLSTQQIVTAQSLIDVKQSVIGITAPVGEYTPEFNLSNELALQKQIQVARDTLVKLHSANEEAIRAKDPSQAEEFRKQSNIQRTVFDTEIGKIVGCQRDIEVSAAGTVACKQ